MQTNYNKLTSNIYEASDKEYFFFFYHLNFKLQTFSGCNENKKIMYIKLIWMIADKLYSNVSLIILTFCYIMALLHNFLYIQKFFLGQKLDLFIIINYISLFYTI